MKSEFPVGRPVEVPTEPRPARSLVVARNAIVFLAVLAGGLVLSYLRDILTPLIVAVFLLMLIDGFSEAIARRAPRTPEPVRLWLGVILTIAGFTLIVGICAHYGREFAGEARELEPKLDALLQRASAALEIPILPLPEMLRGEAASPLFSRLFGAIRGAVSGAILVVIYLGFLLASRQAFGRKMHRLFRTEERRADAQRVFAHVRTASEQYIGLQTFKGLLVAAVSWIIMGVVGLQNAPFMAFLIFLAAYVPIVGGIAGAMTPALLGLAQFDSPIRPLVLLLLLGATFLVIENVLMPKLQSERLNIDPVFVLLALGFWGILLGLPGALLSTPLTVVVMAIAFEFDDTRWLAVLLSKEGEPGPNLGPTE